jgi:hypothetical protein
LPAQYLAQQNFFDKQKTEFNKGFGGQKQIDSNTYVVRELQQINNRLASQPNIGIEIQKVYENVYDIIKVEVKQGMKNRKTKRL